jgi:hypothetical protein
MKTSAVLQPAVISLGARAKAPRHRAGVPEQVHENRRGMWPRLGFTLLEVAYFAGMKRIRASVTGALVTVPVGLVALTV